MPKVVVEFLMMCVAGILLIHGAEAYGFEKTMLVAMGIVLGKLAVNTHPLQSIFTDQGWIRTKDEPGE